MASNISYELKEFLFTICQLDEQLVSIICNRCSNLDEFWNKRLTWIDRFGISVEQVRKIMNFLNVFRRAQAEREEFEILEKIDMKTCNDEEKFEKFYNLYKDKVLNEVADITEDKIKQIYRFELDRYKQVPMTLQLFGSLLPSPAFLPILPKIFEIVKNNPSLVNGLISSADELVAFIKDFDVFATVKSNLAASGVMFLVLTSYSIGKHFSRWFKGDLKDSREFFVRSLNSVK